MSESPDKKEPCRQCQRHVPISELVVHGVCCDCAQERFVEMQQNQQAEIERLTDLKRTCECSEEDQCMFARERDDARTELSKKAGELAECRRLLREACDKLDESEFMEVKVVWLMDKWFDRAQEAAKAGGE